jgi:precorrin-6B methylase 2
MEINCHYIMKNTVFNMDKLKETNGNLDLTQGEINTIALYVINNEKSNPNSKYLEIGVFGGGTIRYLKTLTKSTQFWGVDLFEDFEIQENNTHMSGTYHWGDVVAFLGDRVKLIKGASEIVVPALNEKFDFIFIDGNHSYAATLNDFNNAKNLLTENGQIGFHNCSNDIGPDYFYVGIDGGPWKVCEEVIAMPEWQLLDKVERLKVFKRR